MPTPLQVAGQNAQGLDHKQLVDVIRPLQTVTFLIQPSLGVSGQALPDTQEHVWNQVGKLGWPRLESPHNLRRLFVNILASPGHADTSPLVRIPC